MDCRRAAHAETLPGLIQDTLAFTDRQGFVNFVFQAQHLLTFVVVTNPPFELNVSAARRVLKLGPQVRRVNRLLGDTEHVQPPATGGKKRTSSPSASGCSQVTISSFTATSDAE